MRYKIIINSEKNKELLTGYLKGILGKDFISLEKENETRTGQQNSALHLWFTQLAEELNEKHFDMRAIIRDSIEIPWSGYAIKEYLWRPLQSSYFGKKSTTELFKTKEIDQIYDVINKVITERTNGEVTVPPFPSWESLLDN